MGILDKLSDDMNMVANFMGHEWLQMRLGWITDEEMELLDYSDVLKMNKDWNWVMDIIQKITAIADNWEYETPEKNKFEEIFDIDFTYSNFMNAQISEIWERIIEFIKWYTDEYNREDTEGEGSTDIE